MIPFMLGLLAGAVIGYFTAALMWVSQEDEP